MDSSWGDEVIIKLLIYLSLLTANTYANEIRSFNLTENGQYKYEASLDLNNKTPAQNLIDQLKELGTNHIILNFRAKMIGPRSNDIIPVTGNGPISNEARQVKSLVNYIHSLDMTVGFRPIFFVLGPNGEFPYTETLADGTQKTWWHGNIQPSDPNRWFDSFQRYIDRYLTIAKLARANEFTIGAELYSMTVGIEDQWSEHPHGFPKKWNQLLKYSRKKLGPNVRIMYDINFTDDSNSNYGLTKSGGELERWRYRLADLADTKDPDDKKIWKELASFWNGLDAIGIDMYRSLAFTSDKLPDNYNDLVDLLSQRATSYANQLDLAMLEISLEVGSEKPAYLKEVGFRSVENGFIDPFNYSTAHGELNISHQAAGYEALFKGFWEPEYSWFKGIAFWDIPLNPSLHGESDRGFSPIGKTQTEEIIRRYF